MAEWIKESMLSPSTKIDKEELGKFAIPTYTTDHEMKEEENFFLIWVVDSHVDALLTYGTDFW